MLLLPPVTRTACCCTPPPAAAAHHPVQLRVESRVRAELEGMLTRIESHFKVGGLGCAPPVCPDCHSPPHPAVGRSSACAACHVQLLKFTTDASGTPSCQGHIRACRPTAG